MITSQQTRGSCALSRYLSDIRRYPSLSKQQELELGAQGARDELIESNLGFVVKIACEYLNRGLALEDLLNEGNVGLIRAAARYDHRKGIKFITYASFWVRKAILKALADQSCVVRVPEYQRRKGAVRVRAVSLDDPAESDGSARLLDVLADTRSADPERELAKDQELALLKLGLRCLGPKERAVIAWRFGLVRSEVLTLKEIGEHLGISRERVRQIEVIARQKLRAALTRLPCRS